MLRADGEDAAFAFAESHGWPISVEGGVLVVSFDETLPQVAGDFDEGTGTPLTPDDGFTWLVIPDVPDTGHKLTDGDRFLADPFARSYALDEFGELSLIGPSATHFDHWLRVTDGVVEARTLHIWVPTTTTPTVYAHDGQNLFDPARAPFGSWLLHERAPEGLTGVGIESGSDRIFEYTWIEDEVSGDTLGRGGAAYADFVQNHVQPIIRGELRGAGPSRSPRLVAWRSNQPLHRRPVPRRIRHGDQHVWYPGWGSLGVHRETLLERYVAAGVRSTRIYVDSGGGVDGECFDSDDDGVLDDNESASDNYCTNRQFADGMAAPGYEWDVALWHWWEPGAGHNEAAWAALVGRPLGLFVD